MRRLRYLRWWPSLTYDRRAEKRYARMLGLHKSRKRQALEMRRRMASLPPIEPIYVRKNPETGRYESVD